MASFTLNGIDYRMGVPEDCAEVTEVVAQSFSTEPTTLHCRFGTPYTIEHWRKFTGFFVERALREGLVVVACSPEKKIWGAFVLRDFLSPAFPEEIIQMSIGTKAEHVLNAVDSLDKKWEETHKEDLMRWNNEPGHVVDLWMLAVHSEALGRGISNELTKFSLDLVKKHNFEIAVIECTGHFSQRAAEKSGFNLVSELNYLDYEVTGEKPFDSVPEPHKKWALYEIKL